MQLLILADDLTGAADSAARAHSAGLPAEVLLHGRAAARGATALTSDSRHLGPAAAAERVRALAATAGAAAGALWYKKIDSTLRGNLAAELAALLDAAGLELALVCPAFPAQARGLLDGRLVAPGMDRPDLCALLAGGGLAPAHLPLALVRAGQEPLAEALARAASGGTRAIVADALSDADLAAIEAAAALVIPSALRCGSAGLAGALAARLAGRLATAHTERAAGAEEQPRPQPIAEATRALVVVGSGSAPARRQIAHMRQLQGVCAAELGAAAGRAWGAAPVLLLHLPAPPPGAPLDGTQARDLAGRLADAAARLVADADPGLVLLAGGDTAIGVLERLGVARLRIIGELLPGMALAAGRCADSAQRRFVLKPGAFGADDALADLVARATGARS